MRKFILTFILSILPVVFASSLELFELSHPVYDEMELLYVSEGKSSPMGAKPWTHEDVERLLTSLEPESEEGKALALDIYDYIRDSEDDLFFTAGVDVSALLRSNASLTGRKYIPSSSSLDRQVLKAGMGYRYHDLIALYIDASVGVPVSDLVAFPTGDANVTETVGQRLNSQIVTNIPFLPDSFSITCFPYNAYMTIGYGGLRLVSGRGQLEWGNGVMGNMVLGNTLPYHDHLSITFSGNDAFRYQLLASFFSHSEVFKNGTDDRKPLNGIRMFVGHRFEFSLLGGRISLAVNDSIMYQSAENYLDPRIINPLFFLHNGFMAGNANSLFSFETEYSPCRGLSLYMQFAIDDYAVAGEPRPGEKGGSADGLGLMLGLRFSDPVSEKGYFHGGIEAVYTTPYMYHRAMENNSSYSRELYFVSSLRQMSAPGQSFCQRYLSFPFGSDAVSCLVSAGYTEVGRYSLKGNAFFMAHGVIDEFSSISQYQGGEKITYAPSTSNPLGTDEDKGGVIEYTLSFGAEAEYRIYEWMPVSVGLDLIMVWNKGNYPVPFSADLQLNIGFSVNY